MSDMIYIAIPHVEVTLDDHLKYQGFPIVSESPIYHESMNFDVTSASGKPYTVQFNGLILPNHERHLPALQQYAENLVQGYEEAPKTFTRTGSEQDYDVQAETERHTDD